MNSETALHVGYDEFGVWYDSFRSGTLEPGLALALSSLDGALTDLLTERDLARIRNISGRVKSKRRTWRKLSQPQYRTQVSTVDDIPRVIDDLVGVRITCTNLRDLEMVEVALDGLPRHPGSGQPLVLDAETERDYVAQPKESGYRGWHVNLGVAFEATTLTCELQIRTLLQDSWGELTHEDSYSKAGELPPLVEVLSKRMADLLATLDDIAEDLRAELDRIDEAAVAGAVTAEPPDDDAADDVAEPEAASALAADAAELLWERWRSLDRPVDLASLAWALQQEFGAEVSDDWFGHRSFKRFLRHAVPDGEISTGRQAYLLPTADGADDAQGPSGDAAAEPEAATADAASTGNSTEVPPEAIRLRRVDRGFPLIDGEQWAQVFDQLADAWRRNGPAKPTTRLINQLTRIARDRAASSGEPVSRRHLDYVAKAVFASLDDDGGPLTAAQIADVFASATLQRMADLRILDAANAPRRSAVARWLVSDTTR